MRTLIIDAVDLIDALVDTYDEGRDDDGPTAPWFVALTPASGSLVVGKLTQDDAGGYDPRLFLHPGDYAWDYKDGREVAEEWIEMSLRDTVDLDGEHFEVLFADCTLTTEDTALRLGITMATARKWAERGWFPHARKVGRDWLIPAGDLLCWHRKRPGPEKREKIEEDSDGNARGD